MLIEKAYAAGAPAAGAGGLEAFILPVAILVLFYFFLLRPQQKRQKELQKMIDALQKGDEVLTAGGLMGKVVAVAEQSLRVQIAQNTEIQVQRSAVTAILPKGSVSF